MNNIYEVSREEYKAFIGQLIPECGETQTIKKGIYAFSNIISKKTGKRLCGRRTFIGENNYKPQSEKYYIYEYPDADERQDPIPKIKITLETQQEVQAFFDAVSKMNKERQND